MTRPTIKDLRREKGARRFTQLFVRSPDEARAAETLCLDDGSTRSTLIVSAVLSVVIGPLINSIPTLLLFSVVVGFVGNMLSVPVAALGAILYKGLRPVDFVAK